ncbi:MAG: HAMP domain-containing protein [Synechococcaceae cyanobacterium SM1_2_3]|nr:HAMP domain-containing protein [Synechococcaceae cyanobacterium SM1_2_3]
MFAMFKLNSIKKKLFLASIALVIIPIVCVMIMVNGFVGDRAQNDIAARMNGEMSQISKLIDVFIENNLFTLEMICSHPATKRIDNSINSFVQANQPTDMTKIQRSSVEQELFNQLALIHATHPDYVETYIGTRHGGFITSLTSPMNANYDPRKRPWYIDATNNPGKETISKAFFSTLGFYSIAIVKAIENTNGQVEFVGALEISLKKLTEIINSTKIGQSGYLVLTESDGTILANPNQDLLSRKVSDLKIPELAEGIKLNTGTVFYESDGIKKMATIISSPKAGWKIIGIIDYDEVMSGTRLLLISILIAGIIFALGAMIVGYVIAKWFSDPVVQLTTVAENISRGNFETLISGTERSDELGALARAVERMAVSIKMAFERLRKKS